MADVSQEPEETQEAQSAAPATSGSGVPLTAKVSASMKAPDHQNAAGGAQAAQPKTSAGTSNPNGQLWDDAQATAYRNNLQAWVDRYNMLGGAHKDNVFALKGAKLGSIKHGVNFAATALRTAFSRNPIQLIQGVFQLGMSVWEVGLERRNLNNFAAKVDGMGGGILNHHRLGISLFNNAAAAPRWSDGREVRLEGFDLAMKGLYGKTGRENIVPVGYTPPAGETLPQFNRVPEFKV